MQSQTPSRGFWIIPLPARWMDLAARLAYRRTPLTTGQCTSCHRHRFFSFYFVDGIKFLRSPGGDVSLPRKAMVIVLPFSVHGWSNREAANTGYVHDLTAAHRPHALEA